MNIKLQHEGNYIELVDLLSCNEEASEIYLDICDKNCEIAALMEKLNNTIKDMPEVELMRRSCREIKPEIDNDT